MKKTVKPIAIILGTAMASSFIVNQAHSNNPFSLKTLDSGYQIAMSGKPKDEGNQATADGKASEGKCGSKAKTEGKCGEGKCGSGSGSKAKTEGKCGAGSKTKTEGKCGEGKCGSKN